jgi:hypothetical protein
MIVLSDVRRLRDDHLTHSRHARPEKVVVDGGSEIKRILYERVVLAIYDQLYRLRRL